VILSPDIALCAFLNLLLENGRSKGNCDINIERQKKGTAWKIKILIFQTFCELVPQGKSEGA
jgi:hypothetical protein